MPFPNQAVPHMVDMNPDSDDTRGENHRDSKIDGLDIRDVYS